MQITAKMGERGDYNLLTATIENGNPDQITKYPRVKVVLRREQDHYRWFGVDPASSIIFPIDDMMAKSIEDAKRVLRRAYPANPWKLRATWL